MAIVHLYPDYQNDHVDPIAEGDNSGGGGWYEPTGSFARSVLRSRKAVLVQAAREQMRVEVMPANWGDWNSLINYRNTRGDYAVSYEMEWQHLALLTATGFTTQMVNSSQPSMNPKMQELPTSSRAY